MVETLLTLPLLANWVAEKTVTEGPGPLSLDGPPAISAVSVVPNPTLVRFSDRFADGARVFYAIEQEGVTREAGIGTLTHGTPDTLSRDFIVATLTEGEWVPGFPSLDPVDLGDGQKVVYCTVPASFMALADRVPIIIRVHGALNDPPGSPEVGARYLIYPGPGTGDWTSQETGIAEWTGSEWIFLFAGGGGMHAADGTMVHVTGPNTNANAGSLLVYSANNFRWENLNVGHFPTFRSTNTFSVPVFGLQVNRWQTWVLDGSSITATLPTAVEVQGVIAAFVNRHATTATVNVESSGTISGASSKSLVQWARLQVQSVFNGTTWEWVQIN